MAFVFKSMVFVRDLPRRLKPGFIRPLRRPEGLLHPARPEKV